MNKHIPRWIGWLIVLKGLVNLAFGVLDFFWTAQSGIVRDFGSLALFWNFTPVSALTAILIGFGYIALGRGLYQGKRLAWQISLFWLALNFVDSVIPRVVLFQVVYVVVMMVILGCSHASFTQKNKNPLRPQQLIALFSILLVLLYGVVGSYLLRAQYQGIHTWVDAIYYSLETYSTIGYGDILPITNHAKIFTCSMIILGVGSFVAAVSILLGPAMEQRMRKVVNMVNKLNVPKNHIIVIGATTLGLHTAKVLQNQGNSVILLDPDPEQLKGVEHAHFKIISGYADREETLKAAHINTANAVISALNSDAQNILITMIAHSLRQKNKLKFKIIVRIDEPLNMDYAKQNGADQVISPALILGEMVAKALTE